MDAPPDSPFPPIQHLRWMKSTGMSAPHSLAASGMAPLTLDDAPWLAVPPFLAVRGSDGDPELRRTLADRDGVAPSQVLLAGGASGANFLVCAALLRTGDDVLVETPGYEPLFKVPAALGARVRPLPRRREDGYALDPDALVRALRPTTRLVVLSDLHNPSGTRISDAARAALLELAERRGFFVLFDELCAEFLWERRPRALGALSPWVVTTSSLTKAYGLGGLRAGWAVGPDAVIARAWRVADYVDPEPPSPTAAVALAALGRLRELGALMQARLDAAWSAWERLASRRPALEWVRPAAGPCLALLAPRGDGDGLARWLLERYGVAVVPGSFFRDREIVRLGFGGPPATIEPALERLAQGLDAFESDGAATVSGGATAAVSGGAGAPSSAGGGDGATGRSPRRT